MPAAVLPTAKSLSAFSLKPQSDRLLDHEFEKPDIVPGFFCLKAAIPEVGRWRSDRRRWRCRVERLAHDILAD